MHLRTQAEADTCCMHFVAVSSCKATADGTTTSESEVVSFRCGRTSQHLHAISVPSNSSRSHANLETNKHSCLTTRTHTGADGTPAGALCPFQPAGRQARCWGQPQGCYDIHLVCWDMAGGWPGPDAAAAAAGWHCWRPGGPGPQTGSLRLCCGSTAQSHLHQMQCSTAVLGRVAKVNGAGFMKKEGSWPAMRIQAEVQLNVGLVHPLRDPGTAKPETLSNIIC